MYYLKKEKKKMRGREQLSSQSFLCLRYLEPCFDDGIRV
jgi:hypothetical protein